MLWGRIMTENICPYCNHKNKTSARHCSKCGESIKKRKLDGLEKILIIAGVLLFVFFISWISSSATANNLRSSNLEKTNKIKELEKNNTGLNQLLQACNTNYNNSVLELKNYKSTSEKKYLDLEKKQQDYNVQFQNTLLEIESKLCNQNQYDLDINNIERAGFQNYYILTDKSTCRNHGIFYSQMLSKSKVNNLYALTITENTKGIIKLTLDQNYTIFFGLYFSELSMDYNGIILTLGNIDTNLSLFKDQNKIYFIQGFNGQRIGHIYDINYSNINYLKIGGYRGKYGNIENAFILFIKNYSNNIYSDTIDGIYHKDYSAIPETPGHGIDNTRMPESLTYIQIGQDELNSNKNERIVELLTIKAYNQDYSNKDLNYFIEN